MGKVRGCSMMGAGMVRARLVGERVAGTLLLRDRMLCHTLVGLPGRLPRHLSRRPPARRLQPCHRLSQPLSHRSLQGTDLRDALLGRIFGYAAVVRSGRPLPAGLAVSLAEGLVTTAAKKSFLREVAGALLVLPHLFLLCCLSGGCGWLANCSLPGRLGVLVLVVMVQLPALAPLPTHLDHPTHA